MRRARGGRQQRGGWRRGSTCPRVGAGPRCRSEGSWRGVERRPVPSPAERGSTVTHRRPCKQEIARSRRHDGRWRGGAAFSPSPPEEEDKRGSPGASEEEGERGTPGASKKEEERGTPGASEEEEERGTPDTSEEDDEGGTPGAREEEDEGRTPGASEKEDERGTPGASEIKKQRCHNCYLAHTCLSK